MLGFSPTARRFALTLSALLATVGLAAASNEAAAQNAASPTGIQNAYAGQNTRPWYADQPNYFSPFDFQWGDGKSWVNAYAGVAGKAELSSILFAGDFSTGNVGIVGVSMGREFGSLSNSLRFEWELGGSFHFGNETFATAHAYLIARWIWFPWNKWLMTTFAMGTGPSLATKKSKYEHENGESSYYKNGMMIEATFNLPEQPDWLLQARIQHRSSIFGLLPKAGTPSEYLTLGLKHRF